MGWAGMKDLMDSLCDRLETESTRGQRPVRRVTRLPADVEPANIIAVIDTREQRPLDLRPLQCVPGTLATGDYSVQGLTNLIAVERKSLTDCLSCCGCERERFDREVQRLLSYPCRALVIESTWQDIEARNYNSKITPASALGSLLGWMERGLPIVMAGDHERAGKYVARLLYISARRRWRELRRLANNVVDLEDAP